MARNEKDLTPEEIILIEELGDIPASTDVSKDLSGSLIGLKYNRIATSDPTVNDDNTAGYAIGSEWINIFSDTSFKCVDSSTGAAIWNKSGNVTLTGTETLINKRITERVNTITSSATPTPAGDTTGEFTVTALAANATFAAPTGTPTEGQVLLIRIKDNGTARTLAWNAVYRASTDLALPTTTILSKTLYLQFVYNNTDAKWDLLGLLNNF